MKNNKVKVKIAYCRTSSIYDDSRATKEIKTLLETGNEIFVYGWDRNGDAYERCKEVFAGYVNIVFFFFTERAGKNIINKLIMRMKWSNWLCKKINGSQTDIVHVCDFDTAFPIFSNGGKKYKIVYDIYDYYVDAHPVPKFMIGLVERIDKRIIDNSECVIICNEERKEQIKGTKPKNLVVIHNSPDVTGVSNSEIYYDYVYCGTLGNGRLLKEIFEIYNKYDDLKIYIGGQGYYEEDIKKMEKEFVNVVYGGALTYEKVLEEEMKSCCLSAIYDPQKRNHRLCAPNKFYESLALGKPVIVVRGTGIDKIVEKEKIGIVINYNASEFYEAVRYLKKHEIESGEMGKRAKALYHEKYSWDIMKERLIGLYEKLE